MAIVTVIVIVTATVVTVGNFGMNKIHTCWITVNRACNLRCKWCYAFETGFNVSDNIDFNDAKKIVDFCVELDINRIILIGGEPTLYPFIIPLIEYISNKGIKSAIVSNGIIFSDIDLLKKYIDAGLERFSISVKGNSREEYIELTGNDCYTKVIQAINNLHSLNAIFSVSQVLTYDNISTFTKGLAAIRNAGATNFSFSFCYNFNCAEHQNQIDIVKDNPYVLAELFKRNYDKIDKELAGCHYSLTQGLPLCVWDMSIIEKLSQKKAITSICQLMSGGGILFNTNLSLIPCNAMFSIEYGKFLRDFKDKETFEQFMRSNKVNELFCKLRGVPDLECLECKKATYCGGGCVTNWTNYSFKDLQTKLKSVFENWIQEHE